VSKKEIDAIKSEIGTLQAKLEAAKARLEIAELRNVGLAVGDLIIVNTRRARIQKKVETQVVGWAYNAPDVRLVKKDGTIGINSVYVPTDGWRKKPDA